ncbi:hypothetical protein [Stenotrophomonas maltophilia]|uniref:hypothetical protein n=1 Tax=Stenotrophomonas maltophilia TaxID=40324 RepID=UPI00192CEF64|nr:hypothetical protein [Stenotrophomonas maltophilia]
MSAGLDGPWHLRSGIHRHIKNQESDAMRKSESRSDVSAWYRIGLSISAVSLCAAYSIILFFPWLKHKLGGAEALAVVAVVICAGTIASTILMWVYAIKEKPWQPGRRSVWFTLQFVLLLGPWSLIGMVTLVLLMDL